jgi:hypothetical protein
MYTEQIATLEMLVAGMTCTYNYMFAASKVAKGKGMESVIATVWGELCATNKVLDELRELAARGEPRILTKEEIARFTEWGVHYEPLRELRAPTNESDTTAEPLPPRVDTVTFTLPEIERMYRMSTALFETLPSDRIHPSRRNHSQQEDRNQSRRHYPEIVATLTGGYVTALTFTGL